MTLGYAISALLCIGGSCEMLPVEPSVSYPTEETCAAALAERGRTLGQAAAERRPGARLLETVCLQPAQTITPVEERRDALGVAVAHAEPSATSGYVGMLERGQRTLVTGVVDGTRWLRVLLNDGSVGFVYADRLGEALTPASAAPAPAPTSVPALPAPAATAAGRTPPPILPRLEGEAEFQDCLHCPTMVRLPGGAFTMGSSLDPSERPPHRVTVPTFALGKFEVTAAEWAACVAGGGCTDRPAPAGAAQAGDAERRPATNLSWDDAGRYVAWLRQVTGQPYRLPSEAEWEYAARAGTTTRYSWGEQPSVGQADCDGCGGASNPRDPADVSAFPANAWGLFAMQGGVAEWVEDCWQTSYRGAPTDGSAWRGPKCSQRVLRGGSWRDRPAGISVSRRNFYDAGVRYPANGLRVALTLP